MRHSSIVMSAVVLGALTMGCAGLLPHMQVMDPGQAQIMANQQVDAVMVQRVNAARQAAQASPGEYQATTVFARELENAYTSGTIARGALEDPALLTEAIAGLKAAAEAHPAQAHVCQAVEGTLLIAAGDPVGGVAALQRSMDTAPNLYALPPLLAQMNPESEAEAIAGLCVRTRERVSGDKERFALLDHCQARSAASGVEGRLAWASEDDRAFYLAKAQELERQRAAEAAAAAQQRAEERERLNASFAQPAPASGGGAGGGGSSAAAGPSVVSVTIRSDCPQTAKVFYGDKPKYGSGTRSTISSNSVSSHSFRPGDMFWLTDEKENGLASVKVSAGMREIKINRDCSGLTTR